MIGICNFCKNTYRKREKKYRFCSLTCSSRFNLNGLKQISLPEKSTSLAEFIGICLGDGSVLKYQVSITLNSSADKEYIPYVIELSNKLFPGISPSLIKKGKENAVDIRMNSRIVADFLKNMGIVPNAKSIPLWIMNNPKYRRACTRGLFDTEGSISFKKYLSKKGLHIYKHLNFRNVDIKLMKFVRDNLLALGAKPTMTLKRSLYLSNHRSIDLFRQKIGFSNPKLIYRSHVYTINDLEMLKITYKNNLS